MKAVILAGGLPSTITDEKEGIPKPMLEIGGYPMLWHIMKHYSNYGINEFIVCGGYKTDKIKDYFKDFYIYQSDITVDLQTNSIQIHKNVTEDWKVTVVDTGLSATTVQRIVQIGKYIEEEAFLVTYGDCLSDINLTELMKKHKSGTKLVTMAVAKPTGRNATVEIDINGNYKGNDIAADAENSTWVNACVYVFSKKIFEYIKESYFIEHKLLEALAGDNQIATYKHTGFWTPVETKRDRVSLEAMWKAETAKWKTS